MRVRLPPSSTHTTMFVAASAVVGANPRKAQGGCGVQFPSRPQNKTEKTQVQPLDIPI